MLKIRSLSEDSNFIVNKIKFVDLREFVLDNIYQMVMSWFSINYFWTLHSLLDRFNMSWN